MLILYGKRSGQRVDIGGVSERFGKGRLYVYSVAFWGNGKGILKELDLRRPLESCQWKFMNLVDLFLGRNW